MDAEEVTVVVIQNFRSSGSFRKGFVCERGCFFMLLIVSHRRSICAGLRNLSETCLPPRFLLKWPEVRVLYGEILKKSIYVLFG